MPGPSGGGGGPVQANVQPTGLPYGEATQLHNTQAAIGLPNANAQQAQQASAVQAGVDAASQSPLGATPGGLSRPTDNPNEHVMNGAPSGPGAGPEILGPQSSSSISPVQYLEGLYLRFPYPQIRDLLIEARKARAQPIPQMMAPVVGDGGVGGPSLLPPRPDSSTALSPLLTPAQQQPPVTPLIPPTGAEAPMQLPDAGASGAASGAASQPATPASKPAPKKIEGKAAHPSQRPGPTKVNEKTKASA